MAPAPDAAAPPQGTSKAGTGSHQIPEPLPDPVLFPIAFDLIATGASPDSQQITGLPLIYSHSLYRGHRFSSLGPRQYFFDRAVRQPRMSGADFSNNNWELAICVRELDSNGNTIGQLRRKEFDLNTRGAIDFK